VRAGRGGPPILGEYWTDCAFWSKLGIHRDEAYRTWPHRKYIDYLAIMEAEVKISRERSGTASVQDPASVEEAYARLPRRKRGEAPTPSS
jgi:hypothetical protein